MRYRIAAFVTFAVLVTCAAQPRPSAPVARSGPTPSAPPSVSALALGAVSPREAKPHHVRAAHRVHVTVTAPSTPAPAPVQSQPKTNTPAHTDGYHGSVPDLIRSVFGSASGTALCIAYRESHFDPYARNPHSSASGVFQLTQIWWNGRWHFNPFSAYLNVHYAHEMFVMYGWGPWGGGC